MEYIETRIKGVWLLEPRVFNDARGYFMETYRKEDFDEKIGKVDFVQDNESKSSYGVVRGLHYQRGTWSQAKLVRVTEDKGVVKAVGAATPAAFSVTLYRKYTGMASAERYDLVRF